MRRLKVLKNPSLSFLYLACLVTIALIYTVFRVTQNVIHQQELRTLRTIQLMGQQRETVSEFERNLNQLMVQPPNSELQHRLTQNYDQLIRQHEELVKAAAPLLKVCDDRACGLFSNIDFFPLSSLDFRQRLLYFEIAPNDLLKAASAYQTVLRDMVARSFERISERNEDKVAFDFIAYFSLIMLLLIQAIYVFRPTIRKLNESLATRSDFLSRISHEIRNPMNSIIGMADILKGTRLNSEQQQYVDNLLRSGHALLDILNNLIDSAALERGRMVVKPAEFDLFQALDRALSLIAVQAHHKNLNLYVRIDPQIEQRLIGDSVRLEQVLINLLNNAVKFTEQGSVTLRGDRISETESTISIQFSVEDTGIGIRREQRAEIFESFVQADSYIKRKYGGSGLGLSISREIVDMMGGKIRVDSELGAGSIFWFTVPFKKLPSKSEIADKPLSRLYSTQVIFLVASIEEETYINLFRELGVSATVLTSSQQLRNYFQKLPEPPSVDLVLIDDSVGIISMINCRNIAQENGQADRAVALIRTNCTKENMDLLQRNGFTLFRIKPLRPWELCKLPHEISSDGDTAASPEVFRLKEKNLRVLLVDDSNDNLFLLKEVISPFASVVHFAENGLDAIEKFRQYPYDAIFMDIQMPVMDGYTAIRKMREIEMNTGRKIPVYAVTAHAGLVDEQKCLEAGFTGRIVKPVVRSDIYRSLSKAFDMPGTESEAQSTLPRSYSAKLLPTFFQTRREDLARLRVALAQADFQTIEHVGHKIKGSSASYGFPSASRLSQELEVAGRNHDLELCSRLAQKLSDYFTHESHKGAL